MSEFIIFSLILCTCCLVPQNSLPAMDIYIHLLLNACVLKGQCFEVSWKINQQQKLLMHIAGICHKARKTLGHLIGSSTISVDDNKVLLKRIKLYFLPFFHLPR